jgi:hypothetical protein
MISDQIYQHLVDLAEKLGIDVSVNNLKISGFPVKSGICKIKGKNRIVLDKSLSTDDQIDILIECLRPFPIDDIYIIPAIRNLFYQKPKGVG